MSGFFESLKRMVEGKPVFDANDDAKGWIGKDGQAHQVNQPQSDAQGNPEQSSQPPQGGIVKGSPHTYPVVVVKRTRTQLSGNNQTVYCSILNRSQVVVELEDLHLLGSSRVLGGDLRPGQEREYTVYTGPRTRSVDHHEATLNYKVEETGDYFQSIYDVEYQFEQSDKTYSVEELHLRLPIRDIYG